MSAYILFHYVFLPLSEANWFFKVREGRSNGNVVDAETFDGIAEVMLIVQVIFLTFVVNVLVIIILIS